MNQNPISFLLLLLVVTTVTAGTTSTLDPKQIRALQSLNIPTSKDPCLLNTTATCDSAAPFRHLLSLRLTNCSDDLEISTTALTTLSSLTSLSFYNCPVATPPHFPPLLTSNLHSFTCIDSLQKLSGVFLGRFKNLTDLTLAGVAIKASGLTIILGPMKKIQSLTISNTNLHGSLPKHWHLNLTHIDLSANNLSGVIPSSLTSLENLKSLNLSNNSFTGKIPFSIGNLVDLQNMSLSSNLISGAIPDSMSEILGLSHLDLGSNKLNGTVPKFISEMKNLKFLNLEKNNFHGVMPFNGSFIKRLVVFKIGGNDDLCYNHTSISKKLKLGIAPCDKHGLPVPPPPAKDSSSDDSSGSQNYEDDGDEDDSDRSSDDHHGPSKVVIGVAVGLSSLVFLVVFFCLLSKCCRR